MRSLRWSALATSIDHGERPSSIPSAAGYRSRPRFQGAIDRPREHPADEVPQFIYLVTNRHVVGRRRRVVIREAQRRRQGTTLAEIGAGNSGGPVFLKPYLSVAGNGKHLAYEPSGFIGIVESYIPYH